MKTEVFMSVTPGLGRASKLQSLHKSPEDAVTTILLLDTPQNTPVGTPGSDFSSGKELIFILTIKVVKLLKC